MTTITVLWPESEGEVWTDEAIEGLVGQTAKLDVLGEPIGSATVTGAARAADGRGIMVSLELP